MERELDPLALAQMRALKQALDPRNLFNPGKVTGDPDTT
jgi:glycolate oxidase